MLYVAKKILKLLCLGEVQVNNFLSLFRTKTLGKARINYGELDKWFRECSNVLENEEEPYIVDYIIRIEDYDKKSFFRFTFTCSTKKLIADCEFVFK